MTSRLIRCALLGALVPLLAGCAGFFVPAFGADPQPIVKIGIQLPQPLREAALLAFNLELQQHYPELRSLRVQPVVIDAGDNTPQAVNALKRALEDPTLLAVIGPPTAQAAQAELPLASEAQLAVLSPNITDPCLTQVHTFCASGELKRLRPYGATLEQAGANMFFRLCATSDLEGPVAADYAFATLGRQVAVAVDDGTAPGLTQAQGFETHFSAEGGTATELTLSAQHPVVQKVIDSVRQIGATAVFYGGSDATTASQLAAALQPVGGVTFLATDAVLPDTLPSTGFAATTTTDVTSLPAAADFVAAYNRAGLDGSLLQPGYAAETLDAVRIMFAALRGAVSTVGPGGQPFRSDLLNRVAALSNFQGVFGPVAFDAEGDTSARMLSVDRYDPSRHSWTYVEQGQYGG